MDEAQVEQKAAPDALVERMARAQVLAQALHRADPDDADQLATAWVAEHRTNGPQASFGYMVEHSAAWWADTTPRAEVAIYVVAGIKKLAASALAPAMRRSLIVALWRGLSKDDKRAFIERVTR